MATTKVKGTTEKIKELKGEKATSKAENTVYYII